MSVTDFATPIRDIFPHQLEMLVVRILIFSPLPQIHFICSQVLVGINLLLVAAARKGTATRSPTIMSVQGC
jgi:hypothetical protein